MPDGGLSKHDRDQAKPGHGGYSHPDAIAELQQQWGERTHAQGKQRDKK